MSDHELPICPNCENANHVVLVSNATKAGTALGGIGGATLAVGSTVATGTFAALGSVVPVVGNIAGGMLGSALASFFAGAAVGNKVGEYIYSNVIRTYRCNKCGAEFEI